MSLLTLLDNFIMKVEPEWKTMHGVADKRIKQVADIYEKALINLRNSVDVDRLSQEPIPMMADKIDWQKFEDDCDKAYEVLGLVLIDGGNVAAKYLSNKLMTKINHNIVAKRDVSMPTFGGGSPEGLSLTGSFDMRNPAAVQWASQHVGENIRQVNQASKDGIRQILTDAQQYGGHSYETARQIRQFIGLTDRQISGILKYQGKLDEEGRPKAQVDRMVDAQIRRKIRARANTIARTETIAASAAGQQLHWEDQMSKGYLNNNEMEKVWIVTPDDKLCPICAAMGDERTAIDGTFTFGGKAPPRHPNCRCAIGLEEKKGMELEGYMDSDKGKDWTNVDQLLGLPAEGVTLPAKVIESVKEYTTGSYNGINKYLRTGNAINKEYAQKIVDNVDTFIFKSPQIEIGKTLHRGTDLESILSGTDNSFSKYKVTDENAAMLKRKLMGKTYSDKAYTSTGEELVEHYVGDVEMRILTTDKTKAAALFDISEVANEKEFLFARNSMMQITDVKKEGKKFVVYLTDIGPKSS